MLRAFQCVNKWRGTVKVRVRGGNRWKGTVMVLVRGGGTQRFLWLI